MHRGYIKIWRRIQDNFLNSNSELFHLWINLLLLASHKDTEFVFNGKKTIINGGQFITGRHSLSLLTGIHESKIYRLLHILENEQLIEQQKTNLYTIVSIINYNQYQENEQLIEQQMNNQRTTSEQPVNTINHKETQRNTNKNKDVDGKKPPSSPLKKQKRVVIYERFCERYKEQTGQEYIKQWGKDQKLLKPILQNIKSPEHWEGILDEFFADSFAATAKYTFGVLISGINRYNKESNDNIPVS